MAIRTTHSYYEPQTQGQEAQSYVNINPRVAFENVLTVAHSASRYAASVADVDRSSLLKLFAASRHSFPEFMKEASKKNTPVTDTTTPNGKAVAAAAQQENDSAYLVLQERLPSTDFLKLLGTDLAKLLASLTTKDKTILDYGPCVTNTLTQTSDSTVSTEHVVTAASGFPLARLLLRSEFQSASAAYTLPNPYATEVESVAVILLLEDLWRLNFYTFVPKNVLGAVERDKGLLAAFRYQEMVESLYAYFTLYRLSAVRLLTAHHSRLREIGIKLDDTNRRGSLPAMRKIDLDAREAFSRRVAHPWATYLESVWATGDVFTFYGIHPAIWYHLGSEPSPFITSTESCEIREGASVMLTQYRKFLAAMAAPVTTVACEVGGWGIDKAVRFRTAAGTENTTAKYFFHPAAFEEMIESEPGLTDRMNAVARELGWQAVTGRIGTIDRLNPDFAVTDGLRVDRTPDQCVLGLTPVFSLGSRKSMAMDEVIYETSQSRTNEVEYWSVCVNGMFDITPSRDDTLQRYIVGSMWMGEPNARTFTMDDVKSDENQNSAVILAYFRGKSSTYLESLYRLPPNYKPVVANGVPATVWEPYYRRQTVEETLVGWKAFAEAIQEAVDVANIVLRSPATGNFLSRVNVRRSIENTKVKIGNRLGVIVAEKDSLGRIIVDADDQDELTTSWTELDKFLAFGPMPKRVDVLPTKAASLPTSAPDPT